MPGSAYKYIESSGLILPDTAELKRDVETEFRAAFGDDLDLTPETPQGRLVAVETEARDAFVRNNAEVANQINPDYAGGVFLDAIAGLTGLPRRSEEPSIVKAQLRGVPGSIIPAGIKAATEAGDVFYSKATLVLDNQGCGEAWFYSEVSDAVPAPIGSLTVKVDQVLGWETITNAAPATLGQPVESDAVFRKRREDTLYLQGVALPGAICSGVRDTPGVRSMQFRENYTHKEKTIDGVTIPPHTVWACVDGGTDEDVAQMLFTKKSLGCGWMGEVEVEVRCPESGQLYLVRFDRPEYVPVRARVWVHSLGAAGIDSQTIVRRALADYADDKLERLRGFLVGAPVSPFDMTKAIGQAEHSLFIPRLEVGPLAAPNSDLKPETMRLELWQKATITQASIDVLGA